VKKKIDLEKFKLENQILSKFDIKLLGIIICGMDELTKLLAKVNRQFKTYFDTIKIADKELKFLQITNMKEYIEKITESNKIELPYWAKIWEGSIVLAYLVSKRQPHKSSECLEIGAGIGVAGLFAAAFGYKVTITDIDKNALLFAKISAIKNGLNVNIKKLDFTKDNLNHRYDLIFASEVLYKEDSYIPLINFFKNHLKEDGLIYLAKNRKIRAEGFFNELEKDFFISKKEVGLKGGDEKYIIPIYEIWLKGRENA